MKTILIIAALYCVYKILSGLSARQKEAARKSEAERIRKEQESIRAEQARQREQIKAQIERAKLETKERIEAEKRRIEWQKRQDEINRRAEAERVRLAKEVARHDDMLFEFGYRLEKAETEIAHFSAELDTHNAQREAIVKELADISERLSVFEMTSAGYSDNSGPVFSGDYGPNRNAIDFTGQAAVQGSCRFARVSDRSRTVE